ncbi:hypothetical protein [Pseudonocardia sp. KRD291]|uniref:hypothetical protein n=1 Tax=Pseudonocardia sp. KRD291 TaxID=2792007 RepID=UPI001C4A18B4|nr:hypothetical protein [Pseudonocardia sp. KRD291]MBW0101554.1 hypothetical protein [Pseudonocardia sp. KRD291]
MSLTRPRRGPYPADVAVGAGTRSVGDLLAGRLPLAAATLAYVGVLHLVYLHAIVPTFTYLRYDYRVPDPFDYTFALALVVGLALVLPSRIARPSQFFAWTLFLVAVAPSIVVPQYASVLDRGEALEVACWVAATYLPVALFGTRRAVRGMLPGLRLPGTAFWTGFVAVSAAIYAYLIAVVGLRWDLPSLGDVYGVRAQFAETGTSHAALNYVVPVAANVLNPLAMARGLVGRRWVWLAGGVIGQVFIYSFTGYKVAALSPAALLVVYLLFRCSPRPAAALALIGTTALAAAMWLMDHLTSTTDYTSIMVRRFLITPGLLTAAYVHVFGDLEKVALSHSFLSSFSTYPYGKDPPQLVGTLFFGNPDTHANANLFADGYANFGYPGMALECLVLLVLLWLIDDACRGISIRVSSLILVMPVLALADSGIFTTMLTHGLVAAIVVCALVPRSGWEGADRP